MHLQDDASAPHTHPTAVRINALSACCHQVDPMAHSHYSTYAPVHYYYSRTPFENCSARCRENFLETFENL